MGGSKKQTVGYWYKLLLHFGWCQGPIDAFLEFRGGDRAAWKGELTQSGQIQISARELWGGEEKEGGIEGAFDVMLGEADQQPNGYLAAELGPQQSAYRGRASGVFRGGRYGAFNPYPKPASFKLRRILKGWDDDAPWYPEMAAVPLHRVRAADREWRYLVVANSDTTNRSGSDLDDSLWLVGKPPFASAAWSLPGEYGFATVPATMVPPSKKVWMRTRMVMAELPPTIRFQAFVDNDCRFYVNGVLVVSVGGENGAYYDVPISTSAFVVGENIIAVEGWDRHTGSGNWFWFDWRLVEAGSFSMNAAHMLYDSLVSRSMQGEPVASVNDASFRSSANRLYGEGFGLCTTYDPAAETIEEYQQRICNVIGGTLGRSPITGQWYLDLVRGDFALEDLPIVTDDDILEWGHEPSTLDDAVSQVVVAWRDPEAKEDRVTAPVQSLGAIQAFGVISETATYREIPTEELALRVAARDLQAKSTPLQRFPLVCKRTLDPRIRAGRLFRLQTPRRGVADMVCLAGSMDYGTTRASAIRLEAVQSVFGMPQVAYVAPEPGIDTSPSDTPEPAPAQRAFEVPYVELAGSLSAADLAALAPDAGYVALVAARPDAGLNYTLATSAEGTGWEHVGQGDWCPSARIVEAADLYTTEFTLSGGYRLEWVATGSAALWGNEIVRVDAIDPEAGTITLGRGCADTVPARKSPGERIWFYDAWAAGDPAEYVEGEEVGLKALTRVPAAILDQALAPASRVIVAGRAARPYPPGLVRVNGQAAPQQLHGELVVTWAHRDRVQQADLLVDHNAAAVGPEPGTTYSLRSYIGSELVTEQIGIEGASATVNPGADGVVRIELESVRDGLVSWHRHVLEFDYTTEASTATPLLDAQFTTVKEIGYYQVLPPALVDFEDAFDTDQLTTSTTGTAVSYSITGGKLELTGGAGDRNLFIREGAPLGLPQTFVAVDVDAQSASSAAYLVVSAGIFKDTNNWLYAEYDIRNRQMRLESCVGGVARFHNPLTRHWDAPYQLGFSLVGNRATLWVNTGTGWVPETGLDISAWINMKAQDMTQWVPSMLIALNGAASLTLDNFRAGRFGGVCIRDTSIVTTPDGAPYIDGDACYLLATTADSFGTSYQGVFRVDLVSCALEQTGVIMLDRGGERQNDHASHIIRHPDGSCRLTTSTWGNGFGSRLRVMHALEPGDILHGSHLVAGAVELDLPYVVDSNDGAYDPHLLHDGAQWVLAYSVVTNINFIGDPFWPALAVSEDLVTWSAVGEDAATNRYEGTKLYPDASGSLYVLAGGRSDARVYDSDMNYLGNLQATFHGGTVTQPHPMVFDYGGKRLMLTFNDVRPPGVGATFTWGQLVIQEAPL